MIVCPNCKEEIDDDSRYCDQCSQHLAFCERCGRVGNGKRCTSCGGVMLPSEEYYGRNGSSEPMMIEPELAPAVAFAERTAKTRPQLIMFNDSLGIRITGVDGAIIGRRQGPYVQFFQQNMYVSGVHAQIKFDAATGWCVIDKNSLNGTKQNNCQLQPDVETPLKSGDIVTLANVALRVSIK